MKKYIFYVIFVVVGICIGFYSAYSDSQPQPNFGDCPPGFEKRYIRVDLGKPVASCEPACTVIVAVCCRFNSADTSWDYVISDYDTDNPAFSLNCYYYALHPEEALRVIERYLTEIDIDTLCMDKEYPPCDHPTQKHLVVRIDKGSCRKVVNEYFTPFIGDEPFLHPRVVLCYPSAFGQCITTYKYCTDYSTIPPSKRILKVGFETNLWCNSPKPQIPPDGKTWERARSLNFFVELIRSKK